MRNVLVDYSLALYLKFVDLYENYEKLRHTWISIIFHNIYTKF